MCSPVRRSIFFVFALFLALSFGGMVMAEEKTYTVADVTEALNVISGGRVIMKADVPFGTGNPFVVTKTSNIPGKAVTETPGLVVGNPKAPVRKIAVGMTLTESAVELAGATGVDAIVVHHPMADGTNSGGVPLRNYSSLYNIAFFELHEAFHGRHPGIAWMHGHVPYKADIHYGGVSGNVMYVGKVLPEIKTIGDIVDRLANLADLKKEQAILKKEQEQRESPTLQETNIAAPPQILLGSREDKVSAVLHIFPHTGFTPQQMQQAKKDYPEIDTVIVSISRVKPDHALVKTAKELGLNMVVGNSHALEILENGTPLAYALKALLPGVEVVVFRERMTSTPVDSFGSPAIRDYGQKIATDHLITKK
jgi:hypothetical protein